MFKEKMIDFGRKVIGQGPEVDFKNDVEKYTKDHGVSLEEAQKTLFIERMNGFQNEIQYTGSTNSESTDFRNLEAAFNELFHPNKLEQLKVDAEDPKVFKSLPLKPISPRDYGKMSDYYKKIFEGRSPELGVVKDSTEKTQLINELIKRFCGDRALKSGASLDQILLLRPELGADLGKILLAKQGLDRHQRMFGKELNFEKELNNFKETAKESLTTLLWEAPTNWLKTMVKGSLNPNFGNFAKMVESTAKFGGKELWAGSKLLYRSARAAGSYLSKLAG